TEVLRYAVRRVLLFALTLAGVAVIVAVLLRLVPGDPAAVFLGENATPNNVAELRQALGLDLPWPVQLSRYLAGVARGDLGTSLFQREPVIELIAARLPATLELALSALLFGVVAGVLLGVVSALKQGTVFDLAVMLLAQVGVSVPVFYLGILLSSLFAVRWGMLPAVGRGSLAHLVLPALTLGLGLAALASRLVRASLLDTIRDAYVRSARAQGLPPGRIVAHALRNALLPVVSVLSVRVGVLLGGSVLTENIFGWPGLGSLAVTAISQRDFPLVQGIVLVFASIFLVLHLAIDLAYGVLDPRIRIEAGGVSSRAD
ncbi:MAG TPA: ABC transporter permease, partial [Vicinamibacteria bacterium]|nr:ABC transporter permease [Vicinamibacteria bacterium]